MKRFLYFAQDKQRKKVKGMVEASSEKKAVTILRERGLFISSLKPAEKKFDLNNFLAQFSRVSGREVVTFTRVLGTMVRTGLSLTSALDSLMTEATNIKFKTTIEDINKKIQGGSSLAAGMKAHRDVFSEFYISLIEAGETAGNLDKVLERLATMLEASEGLKSKIKSAMIYPAIVTVVMFGIGALMMVMVIPKIGEVYEEMGADLPLPTQILVSVSGLFVNFWWLAALIIGGLIFLISRLRKNKQADYFFNNLMMRLPIFGAIKKEGVLALFTRTLGILLQSGVAILRSLQITAKTLGNNIYQEAVLQTAKQVEKGTSLSQPLQASGIFPGIVIQMVVSGEETGTIDESLLKLAAYFDEEVDRKAKNLTSVLEPVMIVIMGAAVAGLAIAVLLPMFNLVNVIR